MKTSIGFIGLGAMGAGMASHILEAGYPLHTTAHRNRDALEALLSRGAVEHQDPAAVVRHSEIILLCLPNSDVVDAVLEAMTPGFRTGHVLVDTGTSSVSATRQVQQRLEAMRVRFAEAPLTGGAGQAEAGELGALVGADSEVFDRIKPVLESFCASVQHFGPVGAGGCAKMVNNYMVFGIAALVFEAFHLADEAGVDWAKLYDVVIRGSADSGVFRRMIGNAIHDDFRGYIFNVAGAHKDMRYINELMEEFGLQSVMSEEVLRKFREADERGYGQLYISELLRPEIRRARGGT